MVFLFSSFRLKRNEMERNGEISDKQLLRNIQLPEISRLHSVSLEMTGWLFSQFVITT